MHKLIIVGLMCSLTHCGKKNSSREDSVPDYEYYLEKGDLTGLTSETDTNFIADWQDIDDKVQLLQTRGKLIAQQAAKSGKISLDNGQVIQLISIVKTPCPSGLGGCQTSDSSELGIPAGATVADLSFLKDHSRNQGERGTCLAFALNSTLEILMQRQNVSDPDLSEQYTYFFGKKLTDSWNEPGLGLPETLGYTVKGKQHFASESSWPYNEKTSCEKYQTDYPEAVCSNTEAQGGGSSYMEADPRAEAETSPTVTKAHHLFASLGRIKQALALGFPVVAGINANIDFVAAQNPLKKGVISWVFKDNSCDGVCGHAIAIVGYHDSSDVEGGGYVLIKNSWGSSWGEDGISYATYTWLEASLLDAVAIESINTL